MRTAKTLIRLGGCPGDLSLRWAHMPFSRFCREAAHILNLTNRTPLKISLRAFMDYP